MFSLVYGQLGLRDRVSAPEKWTFYINRSSSEAMIGLCALSHLIPRLQLGEENQMWLAVWETAETWLADKVLIFLPESKSEGFSLSIQLEDIAFVPTDSRLNNPECNTVFQYGGHFWCVASSLFSFVTWHQTSRSWFVLNLLSALAVTLYTHMFSVC